jgi:hypothetical protein
MCAAQAEFLAVLGRLTRAPSDPAKAGPGVDRFRVAEVAAALTWSQYAAEQAGAMASLATGIAPELRQDLANGELDWAKLRMLQHETADVAPEQVSALLALLRPEFARCTVGQLRERLRRLTIQVDPAAARERRVASVALRRVDHTEFTSGTAVLRAAYLPTETAAAAWGHVDQIAQAVKRTKASDGRTIDQIRADVFADLLLGLNPAVVNTEGPGRRGQINVHIGLTTLACLDDDPALVPGFGPVLAEIGRKTVEQMAETARWRFTVADDFGQVVAEGRLRYRPTPIQRSFIVARDVTCRAPGCRRPARLCDIDHVTDWAKGGLTTVDNLCSLCRFHHQAKHKGGFRLRRTADGIEWVTPLGRRYAVLPHDGAAPIRPAGGVGRKGGRPGPPDPPLRR